MNTKQKINFIYNLKETTIEVLDELLIIAQTHINKENKIDQYYWITINVVEMHSWQKKEANRENEYKAKCIHLGKNDSGIIFAVNSRSCLSRSKKQAINLAA